MPNKRELQKAATRSAILHAAAIEFATRGYAGTSIADVAAVMGRPKSAIGYHQFSSKAQLAAALVEDQWQRWQTMLHSVEEALPPGIPRLLSLLLVSAVDAREEPIALAAVRLLSERAALGLEMPEHPFVWRDYAIRQVQASIDDGELNTDQLAEAIAGRLLNASFGVFEAENRGIQPVDTENALKALWADLLAGIDRDAASMMAGVMIVQRVDDDGPEAAIA